MLPAGPTYLSHPPAVVRVEERSATLSRIRIEAAVVPGREWLVNDLFANLLRERAAPELLVGVPVVFAGDDAALETYSRSLVRTGGAGGTEQSDARSRRSLYRSRRSRHARREAENASPELV